MSIRTRPRPPASMRSWAWAMPASGKRAPTSTVRAPTAAAAVRSRAAWRLAVGGEVVAAEQAQGDVVEQQGPEGDLGAVGAGGVGGDDRAVRATASSRSALSDRATSTIRSTPSGAWERIAAAGSPGRGRRRGDHRGIDPVQFGAASDSADDRGPAPAGELGGQRADPAEHAVTSTAWPSTGPSAKTARWG